MDAIGPGQIELKVHGLVSQDHGQVPARVFANKLKQFVMALEAADVVANGSSAHSYVLASMHMSQPTAVVSEVLLHQSDGAKSPALPTFFRAIEAIKSPNQNSSELTPVISKVNLLASGAESKFGFAEIRDYKSNIVRIDAFLKNRAYETRWHIEAPWYNGVSYGSFDGFVRYVDTRGDLPQVKLLLSAGGKELDCTCRREDVDTLGVALEKRVRVYGKAIYNGTEPLPTRVEVTSIEPVGDPGDFSKWNGAFRPFEPDDLWTDAPP